MGNMLSSSVNFHPTPTPVHLPTHVLTVAPSRLPIWALPAEMGGSIQHGFITHHAVNHALQDNTSTLAQRTVAIRHEQFVLPPNIERYRDSAMCHARAYGKTIYNEQKIRLTTDLYWLLENRSIKPVVVQPTDYYTSLCSNSLVHCTGTELGSDAPEEDLFAYVQNEQGNLIDLYDSHLSNHMGGGTLALTTNGNLVISRQGLQAHVSSGQYVPAGSGSLDWSDLMLRGHQGINALVVLGLERELREECGYRHDHIQRTIVLGFGRDTLRGGQPDFFGLTLLNQGAVQTVNPEEAGLVEHCPPLPLSSTSIDGLRRELGVLIHEWAPLSASTLLMNMQLLMDASDATLDTVLHHMVHR